MFDLQHALATWRTDALRGHTLSAEDADELVMYLEDETEHLIANGMEPEDAFRIAQRNLGDLALLEAEYRQNTPASDVAFRRLRVATVILLLVGAGATGAQVLGATSGVWNWLWEFSFGFSHFFLAIILGWGASRAWTQRSLRNALFYALPTILYMLMSPNGNTDIGLVALHLAQALTLAVTLRQPFDDTSSETWSPQPS